MVKTGVENSPIFQYNCAVVRLEITVQGVKDIPQREKGFFNALVFSGVGRKVRMELTWGRLNFNTLLILVLFLIPTELN